MADSGATGQKRLSASEMRTLFALAAELAAELQARFPSRFERTPVRASRLATALGLQVEVDPKLVEQARWQEGWRVLVRKGLPAEMGRFALAHEIGHAFLHETKPDVERELSFAAGEFFADAFAAEALIPVALRATLRQRIADGTSASDMVALAGELGLSVHAVLLFAERQSDWLKGSRTIWLRVKYAPNAYTMRDAKLRIVSAHCDRERFYVAPNQGLERVVVGAPEPSVEPYGFEEHLGPRQVVVQEVHSGRPKFRARRRAAHVSRIRLRTARDDRSGYLLMRLNLLDGGER